jgi:hypothetical protein
MAEVKTADGPARRTAAKRKSAAGAPALKVFINYRHEDTEEAAIRLYDKLAGSLGSENVFLDEKSIEMGADWLARIRDEGARGSTFLALIGRTWVTHLEEHQALRPGDPPDYVQVELELALSKWPGQVIPVLVGKATMPDRLSLPKPIRRLAGFQACGLRPLSFDQDVDALIAKIKAGPDDRSAASVPAAAPPPRASGHETTAAGIDGEHYDTIIQRMVQQGSVVPVLGAGVRAAPDAENLELRLCRALGSTSTDLAELAQRVLVSEGPSFLEKAIVEALTPPPEPREVDRFLARFPGRLRELKLPERYQMIVTANYDSTLEQAFEDEGEDVDLAIFLPAGTDAEGTNRGRFLHVPHGDKAPTAIGDPATYRDFPIDGSDELKRTLIVKVHGAAEGGEGDLRWDGNYVLTEDQYIDYLVNDQIIRLIPNQILTKLTRSHCLFLGYAIGDWSRRVFLKRVWKGERLRNVSWAIEHSPDRVEREAWKALQVELLSVLPDDYVRELDARIGADPSR